MQCDEDKEDSLPDLMGWRKNRRWKQSHAIGRALKIFVNKSKMLSTVLNVAS